MIDVIAIGGGDMGGGETLSIDRAFVARSKAQPPKVLFIPTASMDDEDYIGDFQRTYGAILGCDTDILRLHSGEEYVEKVTDADVIYVGGGNTKMMLELWQEIGLLQLLTDEVHLGKPVGGLSAGAICWFRVGNSDWPQYEGIPGINTARLDGMNLIDLAACPHTKDEGFRLAEFRAMMKTEGGVGIGLDDGCAIHVLGDEYRILSIHPSRVAHRIEWVDGRLVESELSAHDDFRSLQALRTA